MDWPNCYRRYYLLPSAQVSTLSFSWEVVPSLEGVNMLILVLYFFTRAYIVKNREQFK